MSDEPQDTRSWLEKRMEALDALLQRFGAAGLRDQPIADVGLFLSSKQLQFRDLAKNNLTEEQKADQRKLEMDIRQLELFVKSQTVGLSLDEMRSFRPRHDQQEFRHKERDRGRGR